MKAYPVASIELWGLGGIGLAASLFFSAAASLVTFSIDTQKDLDLAKGIDAAVIAFWDAARLFAMGGGIIFLVLGLAFVAGGSFYIRHILTRTTFGR